MRLAGASLIVWDTGTVRRLSLDGSTEAVLYSGASIRDVEVSHDATKIAIGYGEPLALVVLDAVSGDELLKLTPEDPRMVALREVSYLGLLTVGDWSTRHDELAIDGPEWQTVARIWDGQWHGYPRPPERIGVLTLEGGLRLVPAGSLLSPDFPLRTQGQKNRACSAGSPEWHLWTDFEVIDVATGEVLWEIEATSNRGIIPYDWQTWHWVGQPEHVLWSRDPDSYVYFEYGGPSADIWRVDGERRRSLRRPGSRERIHQD